MILLSAGSPHPSKCWLESRRYCHRFPLDIWHSILAQKTSAPFPLFRNWVAKRKPIILGEISENTAAREETASHIRRSEVQALLLHGALDPSDSRGIMLVAINPMRTNSAQIGSWLEVILPKLYRIVSSLPSDQRNPSGKLGTSPEKPSDRHLSVAEQQVLKWLSQGKTNWEIAMILNRSENTIKHQVASIFTKLNVTTRAQASQWLNRRVPHEDVA